MNKSANHRMTRRWPVFIAMMTVAGVAAFAVWWFASQTAPLTVIDNPDKIPLSELTRSVAAGDILRIIFEGAPPSPRSSTPVRLQIGLYARRTNASASQPLDDGEQLESQGAQYWLGIRPHLAGYLYVVQVGPRGEADRLFPRHRLPSSSIENPVRAQEAIQFSPAEAKDIGGSGATGTVSFYIVFSATQWPELEEALARPMPAVLSVFPPRNRPLVGRSRGVSGVMLDTGGAVFERSIEGRNERVTVSHDVQGAGDFIAIERWFRLTTR